MVGLLCCKSFSWAFNGLNQTRLCLNSYLLHNLRAFLHRFSLWHQLNMKEPWTWGAQLVLYHLTAVTASCPHRFKFRESGHSIKRFATLNDKGQMDRTCYCIKENLGKRRFDPPTSIGKGSIKPRQNIAFLFSIIRPRVVSPFELQIKKPAIRYKLIKALDAPSLHGIPPCLSQIAATSLKSPGASWSHNHCGHISNFCF